MEGIMQFLGLILIAWGLFPGISLKTALAAVITGVVLWFITYFNDGDNDDDWGY